MIAGSRSSVSDSDSLRALNDALAALDDRLTEPFDRPRFPVTFVLGTGRCGSTLLHQAIAAGTTLGVVSNLLARFWRAPYLGATLEADIIGDRRALEFESDLGNTAEPAAPHEWGWFWRHWLRLAAGDFYAEPASLRADEITAKLAAIESVKGAPLFFCNVFARANLDLLDRALPSVLAVHLRRDPFHVCHSMLMARLVKHGDLRTSYGLWPRGGEALASIADPVEQTVRQVAAIEAEMTAQAARLGGERVVELDYASFVSDPRGAARAVAGLVASHGGTVSMLEDRLPASFENRDRTDRLDPEIASRLKRPVAAIFGRHAVPEGL